MKKNLFFMFLTLTLFINNSYAFYMLKVPKIVKIVKKGISSYKTKKVIKKTVCSSENAINGEITEIFAIYFYTSSGWKYLKGTHNLRRNGIDAIFYKKNSKGIYDVLIIEAKYNGSSLKNTLNGKQMSKSWILHNLKKLEIKYPDEKKYKTIRKFVEKDIYRGEIFKLIPNNGKPFVKLYKVKKKGFSSIALYEYRKIDISKNAKLFSKFSKISKKMKKLCK